MVDNHSSTASSGWATNMQSPMAAALLPPRTPLPIKRPRASSASQLQPVGGTGLNMLQEMPHSAPGSSVAKGRKPKTPNQELIHTAMEMFLAGQTASEIETKWEKIGYLASKRTRQYYVSDIQHAMIDKGVLKRDGFVEPLGSFPGSSMPTAPRKNDKVYTYVIQYLSKSSAPGAASNTEQSYSTAARTSRSSMFGEDHGQQMAGYPSGASVGSGPLGGPHSELTGFYNTQRQANLSAARYNNTVSQQADQSIRRRPPQLPVLQEGVVDCPAVSEQDPDICMLGFEPELSTYSRHQYTPASTWNTGDSSFDNITHTVPWAIFPSQHPTGTMPHGMHHRSFSPGSYASTDTGFESFNSWDDLENQSWDISMSSPTSNASLGFSMGTSINSQPLNSFAFRRDLTSPYPVPRSVAPLSAQPLQDPHAGESVQEGLSQHTALPNNPQSSRPIPIRKSCSNHGKYQQGHALGFTDQLTSAFHTQPTSTPAGHENTGITTASHHGSLFPVGAGKYAKPSLGASTYQDLMVGSFELSCPIGGSFGSNYSSNEEHDPEQEQWLVVPQHLDDRDSTRERSFTEQSAQSVATLRQSALTDEIRKSQELINHGPLVTPGIDDVEMAGGFREPTRNPSARDNSQRTSARSFRNLSPLEREQFLSIWEINQDEVTAMVHQQLQGW